MASWGNEMSVITVVATKSTPWLICFASEAELLVWLLFFAEV